ncbi:hypothetical protein POM88_033207 [Heracleum sosnowskyi]|uniref:Uncharacterized protein n=1 Tax=Heracleum sosnowskyi TaxID=360622 RepID=A0AAD8MLL9_9APIA|nr:hypothetical protein POM88_033207 [Heracleum sosnowskyi]
MGSILKFRYVTLDLTLNSKADDEIKDHKVVADDIKDLNLDDEECFVDECASDKELKKSGQLPGSDKVPKKPRTPRVFLGQLTSKPGEDGYQFRSAQVIIDEKNSREREKRPLDEEDHVAPNSREREKRPLDEDHVAPDDDYEEAESSDKKRQKRIEKKETVPRKPVQVYNLPSELPQHFQEYISGLNLEVPPLFVAQKLLTVTDIKYDQGRLSLPKNLINHEFRDNFLTKDEKKLVENKMSVEVNLVDDMMREYNTLHMTQWAVNNTSPIALKRAWNDVVLQNKLKPVTVLNEPKPIVGMEDDNKLVADVVARVWCFRRESNIWFALNLQAMTELKILGTTKKGVPILSK